MTPSDRFALARRVERLPWVAKAEVTRKWPNVVRSRSSNAHAIVRSQCPAVSLCSTRPAAGSRLRRRTSGVVAVQASDAIPDRGRRRPRRFGWRCRILHALSSNLGPPQVQVIHRLDGEPPTYELGSPATSSSGMGEASQVVEKLAAAEAVPGLRSTRAHRHRRTRPQVANSQSLLTLT